MSSYLEILHFFQKSYIRHDPLYNKDNWFVIFQYIPGIGRLLYTLDLLSNMNHDNIDSIDPYEDCNDTLFQIYYYNQLNWHQF